MDPTPVVICFLRHRGDILLFKRADTAPTYPTKWGVNSGYVERDEPLSTASREIREETGIANPEFVRSGDPFTFYDDELEQSWQVNPFLFESPTRDVSLNEETARSEWVPPTEILRRDTVPKLWTSYQHVAPTIESIVHDRDRGSAALSIAALEVLRDAAGRVTVEAGDLTAVEDLAEDLLTARSSMAALRNRINRVMAGANSPSAVERLAHEAIHNALDADANAAANAAQLLTGTVATLSRSGTVIDALIRATPPVIIAESRPDREGIDVAEHLARTGVDVTVCTDAAIAHTLATVPIETVAVGADTILRNGTVINKTGTRGLALAANHEDLPVYVIAATDKVSTGTTPHLESGPADQIYDGPTSITVSNPRFDITPADLIDGIVTERGVLSAPDIESIATELDRLANWC